MAKKRPSPISTKATQILKAFLDASLQRDEPAMRKCLSRRTLESGQWDPASTPGGVTFVLDEPRMEGEQVVIPVRGLPVGAPEGSPPVVEMPCLMVEEGGQWKFDLAATVERMMGGSLDAAVGQLASTMTEAMEGVGKAMADGLSQALGGSATAAPAEEQAEPSWDDTPLAPAPEELLPLPKLETLPKSQAAVSKAVGSKVLFQAAIADLLHGAGSNERDTLVNWFEDQLFAVWPDMLTQAAGQKVLLKGRLRAVRIEAATMNRYRLLALDGSDLVYRMSLPESEGFFAVNDELAALLSGVLAGLPEKIDKSVAGHRLLPTDDESPPVDLYATRVAPRLMRRISALVGHRVGLKAAWDEVRDSPNMGRQLSRWGLARICGGIALACLDPSRREALARDLKTIHLALGPDVTETFVRYEGGTLELGLNYFEGDKQGCYENEIAQVLAT